MEGDVTNWRCEEVFVSHVEDAITFWAQCIDRSQEIAKLSDYLAKICPLSNVVYSNPDLGRIYGGLFSFDNTWYRCRLQNVKRKESWRVTYIDYGNSEMLNRSSIVELPNDLQFPSLAKKYRLWGLHLFDPDISLSERGTAFLVSMINEKQVTVRHKGTNKDNTVVVQVMYGNLDIGEEVLKKGFASWCKSPPSCKYTEDSKMGIKFSHAKLQMPAPCSCRQVERFSFSNHNGMLKPNRQKGLSISQKPSLKKKENHSRNNATLPKSAPVFTPRFATLENSKPMVSEEDKIKCELDLCPTNCQPLETQFMPFNPKRNKEKVIAEKCCQLLEISLQTAVGNKLQSLSAKIALVKKARQKNMTVNFGDDVFEAIRVVSENCIIAPPSLKILEEIWEKYNLAQHKIQLCNSMVAVHHLIDERNNAQQSLLTTVQEFILEVDVIALTERTHTLEELLCSLEAVYGKATETDSSQKDFCEFFDWKQTKMETFRRVQRDTEESMQVLFKWFSDFREVFDLTSAVSLSFEEGVGDIDELLNKAEADVGKELDLSTMGQSETDKKIMVSAHNKVINMIHQEKLFIRLILKRHEDCVRFKNRIAEWLHESPNVDQLLKTKKNLKSIKAQLRCRTIEQRNLEESDNANKSDVRRLKKHISELRQKTFEIMYQEQNEYEKLSDLVKNYFPELPLLYPEAEIINYINSGGLLWISLERELLDAEPMKELSTKRPVVCADFQGQKVLLKGYCVGFDTEGKLIETAAKYHIAWAEMKEKSGLLPLMSLFFCRSDPLAYLMVPFCSGESLGEVQANQPLTPVEAANVMKGVACGLQTLHKMNIVHGSVHQNNVFAVNRKKGILGDFDFTKTEEQRSLSNSSGCLTLTAPEVKAGQQASLSSDMYSYGCLLLWLSHGEHFKTKPDGTPDISQLDMNIKLKQLLLRLVSATERITAEQVIEDEYFQIQKGLTSSCPNRAMREV
ncbi:hypothetical protein NDU88_004447 [Pleurodeles waltl]|uniref:Serine/threonine-protein kinase 31 n=1 Tax=Pleurodeles waltl TaxID=8319 RepID=A0AAV7QEX6_PLEWA|nr:hypothetical protein NDU88_004447 [Pleurodeles waltl]